MRLAQQLQKQRELNARLARARRRMLHSPCPFYVRRFFHCLAEASFFTDSLLAICVPRSHDEQVDSLLHSLHIPVSTF